MYIDRPIQLHTKLMLIHIMDYYGGMSTEQNPLWTISFHEFHFQLVPLIPYKSENVPIV